MVALQSQGTDRSLRTTSTGTGVACQFNIFMDDHPIVNDPFKSGIGNLVSLFIKARRSEDDVIGLPVTWLAGGIHSRRTPFIASWLTSIIPPLIDTAAVIMLRVGLAPTVKNLDLIAILDGHARGKLKEAIRAHGVSRWSWRKAVAASQVVSVATSSVLNRASPPAESGSIL